MTRYAQAPRKILETGVLRTRPARVLDEGRAFAPFSARAGMVTVSCKYGNLFSPERGKLLGYVPQIRFFAYDPYGLGWTDIGVETRDIELPMTASKGAALRKAKRALRKLAA